MPPAPPQIFISYAKEDGAAAARLSETLKVAGFQTWLDQEKLLPGQHWSHEIKTAIKSCDFFIALLSSRSLTKRGFVQREFRQALDVIEELPEFERFLFPVRLDECSPENEVFQGIQRVDLFPQWEVGVNRLIQALRQGKKYQPTVEPAAFEARTSPEAPGQKAPSSVSLIEQLGLPAAVIQDLLGINRLSRRRYRRGCVLGATLLGLTMTAIGIAQSTGFDTDNTDSPGGIAFMAAGSLAIITAGYFFISSFSRWRISYKVRRRIVAHNEVASTFLKQEHPWKFRFLLGAWYFRALFLLLQAVTAIFIALLLLLLFVSVLGLVKGDWTALVLLAVASGALFGLLWPVIRFMKTWSTAQRMAGVVEE